MNLTSQDAQVACFQNAAAHLEPGGRFVIEVGVPDLQRLPPRRGLPPVRRSRRAISASTSTTSLNQGLVSHHYSLDGDRVETVAMPFRYVWPAELDLMAGSRGMRLARALGRAGAASRSPPSRTRTSRCGRCMIELRPAESTRTSRRGARFVRRSCRTNGRPSVAELSCGRTTADTLWLLAYVDGELGGQSASRPAGRRAAPSRSRGCCRHSAAAASARDRCARSLDQALACGYADAGAQLEEPASAAFAARFGFTERNRQIEQVYAIRGDEPEADVPEGITIVALRGAGRPAGAACTPSSSRRRSPTSPSTGRSRSPRRSGGRAAIPSDDWAFLALAGDELVGMAGLLDDEDHPERAENLLTAVRRDLRGRGIARALKQHALRCAADRGLTEVYTWTQTGNEAMQQLNRSLGYVDRNTVVNVRAALPLLAGSA